MVKLKPSKKYKNHFLIFCKELCLLLLKILIIRIVLIKNQFQRIRKVKINVLQIDRQKRVKRLNLNNEKKKMQIFV